MKRTFYFNTGVKFADYPYLYGQQVERGGTKQIPFECENIPDGATFKFACDNPNLEGYEGCIIAPIVGGGLLSKYAYFTQPLKA